MVPIRNKRVGLALGAAALVAIVVGVIVSVRRNEAPSASAPAPTPPAATAAPAEAAPVVYDPTKLLENGVPAPEVFDKEPRTGPWADAVETVVGGAMGRDLEAMVPAAGVAIKCKTLSCLVGVDAPTEQRETALAITKFLMLAPWVVDLEAEEDGTMRWLFFQEPRFADPKAFTDWFTEVRKRTLADIRSGKRPNPFPIAASKAPLE
jgi:hypothetical protein